MQVSALQEVCAPEAEGCLLKEAKKWAGKAAKDYKIVTHGERVRPGPHSRKASSELTNASNSGSQFVSFLMNLLDPTLPAPEF